MRSTPLSLLIRSRMRALGFRPSDLHRELGWVGVQVSLQSVLNWMGGGGIKAGNVPGLARALKVSSAEVALASVGIAS